MNRRAFDKRLRKRWKKARGRLHEYGKFLDAEMSRTLRSVSDKCAEILLRPSPLFKRLTEKHGDENISGTHIVEKFDYSGLKS